MNFLVVIASRVKRLSALWALPRCRMCKLPFRDVMIRVRKAVSEDAGEWTEGGTCSDDFRRLRIRSRN